MKDGPRIYVIYSLIWFKMKKFVPLFFTFSGICMAFAQNPVQTSPSDNVKKSTIHNDSLPKKEKPFIRVFPNPASNKAEVELKGFEPGFVQVQIINSTGSVLRNDKRLIYIGHEIIVLMFSLEPGIYFLVVKQDKKLARTKLIIR